jgi:hypothetical protein
MQRVSTDNLPVKNPARISQEWCEIRRLKRGFSNQFMKSLLANRLTLSAWCWAMIRKRKRSNR